MCVTGERGQKVMQITDVRVRKVAKEGKLKAVVSITMDEEFVVHDIKVIEGYKRQNPEDHSGQVCGSTGRD